MATRLSVEQRFGHHKYYGESQSKTKPKFGSLKYFHTPDRVEVLVENMTFSHLQMKKLEYIKKGWDSSKLKITY